MQSAPSAVSQTPLFFLRGQPRFFENVTLVARQKDHFLDFGAFALVAELPQKERCFNTQESTRFLYHGVQAHPAVAVRNRWRL